MDCTFIPDYPPKFTHKNVHIKQMKNKKISETCLTNHTVYITPLVINALRGRHTHIVTHEQKQF